MNADGIFFVDGDTLRPLVATPYENEDLLQRALVDFPEVLAGRVTESKDQRRLLLVKREKGVPIAEGGGDHFSIDHFFVDSGAVPVLVEVKRQSDTRIRREVVGQMLDYAANGVRYWPIDQIQEEFEQSFEGDDPGAFLEQFSEVGDGAAFWAAVDHNLRDGNIRMLFVADGFPDELVRVIEFLNEQMSPAEVLGVEVKQYTDGDRQVLVPRVIGATTAAEQTKRKWTPGRTWTRTSMIEAASEFGTIEELSLVERLLDFAERSSSRISWGSGKGPRASIWHDIGGVSKYVWVIDGPRSANVPAQVWVWRKDLLTNFGEEVVESFLRDLELLPGFAQSVRSETSAPVATLAELGTEGIDRFIDAVEEFVASNRSKG
ncbi:MAG: hypothetical protein QNM02_13850 [Acidimicrobiia bacterium]|nr:hypothetical protein [Acidimicrobiia bacterium]